MGISAWIKQNCSNLTPAKTAEVVPVLAMLLKNELGVAELSLTVGILTLDEFDEIELLLLTGEAA